MTRAWVVSKSYNSRDPKTGSFELTRAWVCSKSYNSLDPQLEKDKVQSSHQPVSVKQTEKVSLSSHQAVQQSGAIQSAKTPATVAAQKQLPEKRKLPEFPKGDISQQEGEAVCRR